MPCTSAATACHCRCHYKIILCHVRWIEAKPRDLWSISYELSNRDSNGFASAHGFGISKPGIWTSNMNWLNVYWHSRVSFILEAYDCWACRTGQKRFTASAAVPCSARIIFIARIRIWQGCVKSFCRIQSLQCAIRAVHWLTIKIILTFLWGKTVTTRNADEKDDQLGVVELVSSLRILYLCLRNKTGYVNCLTNTWLRYVGSSRPCPRRAVISSV